MIGACFGIQALSAFNEGLSLLFHFFPSRREPVGLKGRKERVSTDRSTISRREGNRK